MSQPPQRPKVGVVVSHPEVAWACVDAVDRSGGEVYLILPGHPLSPAATVERIEGLLVCGEDTNAAIPEAFPFALSLLVAALEGDMPALCIGGGMRALNVAMGGKSGDALAGHSATDVEGDKASSYHRIFISPGSKLAAVVGSGGFVRVNSRHCKAVREAHKSPLLMASAYSLEDGVIEALESPNHRWAIGVQFHPERRKEVPPHFDRLFQSLVERAQEYGTTHN